MFANLRRQTGNRSFQLTKRALIALSRAIEDEYVASGERGLVVGSFQRPAFYRSVAHRWREVTRLAEASLVFASFRSARHPRGAPAEIPISTRDPLSREWGVICDAPGFTACLAGSEIAEDRPVDDADRRFEVVWSFEPVTVRGASESAISIAVADAPGVVDHARAAIGHPAPYAVPETAIATADRIIANLASQLVQR
jgi:DICT domain-containing protein